MHRYVAIIATSENQDRFDQLARRLATRFTNWRCALDGQRAKAWVLAEPPSPIGFTLRESAECLIGAQLGARQPAPWDGVDGNFLLSRTWGAYVAIRIGEGKNINITRDPSGRIPCWSRKLKGVDLYFSNIDDVPEVAQAAVDPIDWDYIQFHLCSGGRHGSQTGLKAISELLPGRQVGYSGDAGRESSAWPIADIVASPFETCASAEANLRSAAADAVGCWARQYDRIALDLSGGFDSAVVLGLIREQAPNARVLAINYLISHPEGDERAYAQAVADHNDVPLMVQPLAPEGRRFDVNNARASLRPNNMAIPLGYTEARAIAASKINAQAAFTGVGGDHVFGQNLPTSMLAEAAEDGVPVLELFTLAHDYAKMSSDTFWNVSWTTMREIWGPRRALRAILQTSNPYLTRSCIDGANFEGLVHPDFTELGETLSAAKLYHVMGFHELSDSYRRYGPHLKFDEVNPLQSQLVLEASLRVPSYWMNPAGRRRGLARRSFRSIIPEAILTRRGKSSNTSHWLQLMTDNIGYLRGLMLDGHLVRRGLLDRAKLEGDLTPQRIASKATLSGLGSSIVTELWVQAFTSSVASSFYDDRIEDLI